MISTSVADVYKRQHLDVQGLMCVGPMNGTTADIEACFEKMQVLYHTLQNEYGAERIRYLSMGMSQDYALACLLYTSRCV